MQITKKYAYFYFAAILFLSTVFSSCLPHDDDDPWLSFRSRNARFIGNWRLIDYSQNTIDNTQITTLYNNTACDTSGNGGIFINNINIQETLTSPTDSVSILNSLFTQSQGGTGTTKVYNANIVYNMNIFDNDTYIVEGAYSYTDADLNAVINGTFRSQENNWHWEMGTQARDAVSFENFPIVDVTAIPETGLPIRFMNTITFDLSELHNEQMQWNYHNHITSSNVQDFEPFTVYMLLDTIYNCEKTITTEKDLEVMRNWKFRAVEEAD